MWDVKLREKESSLFSKFAFDYPLSSWFLAALILVPPHVCSLNPKHAGLQNPTSNALQTSAS